MPTYEYLCENCGYEFEQFQAITAKPLHKCPKCGQGKLKRLIGCGSGIIFKGSGFYQTDYRSESYKKAQATEKKSSDGTKETNETGGGTKTPKVKADKADSAKPKDKKKSA